jgi:hypothetical protein
MMTLSISRPLQREIYPLRTDKELQNDTSDTTRHPPQR